MSKPLKYVIAGLLPIVYAVPSFADGFPTDSFTRYGSYDWSGIYLGASVGGAWGDASWRFTDGGSVPNPNPQNFNDVVGGLHVGIQHQWGSIVLGVEANYIFNSLDGSADCPNTDFNCNLEIKQTWEVGPRAGFAWNNFLIYATGGYANARVETQTPLKATGVNFDASKEDQDGFYVGGGLDWGITRNIILGVEYQHLDFDTVEHQTIENRTIDPSFDLVRARLTFKFDRSESEPAAPLK